MQTNEGYSNLLELKELRVVYLCRPTYLESSPHQRKRACVSQLDRARRHVIKLPDFQSALCHITTHLVAKPAFSCRRAQEQKEGP